MGDAAERHKDGDVEGKEHLENEENFEDDDDDDDEDIQNLQRQIAELENQTSETLAASSSSTTTAAQAGTLATTPLPAGQNSRVYSPTAAATTASAVDENSVYVGNLHESTVPDDLHNHFSACGTINRITILCDKFSGRPKGYAYVEFSEPKAVELALTFNESSLKGNMITVTMKRQNVPKFMLKSRGRGGPFRGRGRGGFPPRGHRGGFRGRFAPY